MGEKSQADYRRALQAAKSEFEGLIQQRVELDKRIVCLKQTINGLTAMEQQDHQTRRSLTSLASLPPRFTRLTHAIRQALVSAATPLRPPQLRNALLAHGLTMSQYSNKLAVIHNTLARLERQGEVIEIATGWTLTEKGKLAAVKDSLDFEPLAPPEGEGRITPRTNHRSRRARIQHSAKDDGD